MLVQVKVNNSFESWRDTARMLLVQNVAPADVVWTQGEQGQLFSDGAASIETAHAMRVPQEFIKLARTLACFDDPEKWPLLYRILFRLKNENKNLLQIDSDVDIAPARRMEKAIGRDVHKFHAFVRFRKLEGVEEEVYTAWHEPTHWCVERATPFFARRFGTMKFSILTAKGCAHWDLEKLTFSPPVDRSLAPKADEMEDFWLLYYRSIFNPFRLKINAMKREFPVKHWPTLPEAVLIPELIREAQAG